jgi:hypothetical protein
LGMMVDDVMVAPVLSQPSLPFAVGKAARHADLNLSPQDAIRVAERAADRAPRSVTTPCSPSNAMTHPCIASSSSSSPSCSPPRSGAAGHHRGAVLQHFAITPVGEPSPRLSPSG